MDIPVTDGLNESHAAQWNMEKQIFQMELLQELGSEISPNDTIEGITKKSLDIIMGKFGICRGFIVLSDDESDAWKVSAHRGFASIYVPLVGGKIFQRIENWRKAFVVVKPDVLPLTIRMLLKAEDFPGLYIPMIFDNEVLGFIYLGSMMSGSQYDKKLIEIMNTAANFLTMVLVNYKLCCQNLDQQQESFRIRGIFEQFYPPELVDRLLSKNEKLTLGFKSKELTVLMADIRGYTSITAESELNLIGELLNAYFSSMTKVIFKNHGVISKFMGDGIMAVFGDPVSFDDDAENGVTCALQMQERFDVLAHDWQERNNITLGLGIGICTGRVLSGNFGCGQRIEYTVVGTPVNMAARLCGIANSGEIYIDTDTSGRLKKANVEEIGAREIKGFREPVRVHKVNRALAVEGVSNK